MKLKQFNKQTLVIFEITDISLKITSQRLFKRETHEILFENILVKDRYELAYHDKSVLPYIYFFTFLFGNIAIYSFFNPLIGWTLPSVFGVPALFYIILFFIKRTKIYIPTKDHGMIRLFQKQPNKKSVAEFIYILEGKVNLHSRKMPKESNLKEFTAQYFPKSK